MQSVNEPGQGMGYIEIGPRSSGNLRIMGVGYLTKEENSLVM